MTSSPENPPKDPIDERLAGLADFLASKKTEEKPGAEMQKRIDERLKDLGQHFNRVPEPASAEEIKIIDGVLCRRVNTGISLRRYFSHDGPGWDSRFPILEKYHASDPSQLPDEPYTYWEPVSKKQKLDKEQ